MYANKILEHFCRLKRYQNRKTIQQLIKKQLEEYDANYSDIGPLRSSFINYIKLKYGKLLTNEIGKSKVQYLRINVKENSWFLYERMVRNSDWSWWSLQEKQLAVGRVATTSALSSDLQSNGNVTNPFIRQS